MPSPYLPHPSEPSIQASLRSLRRGHGSTWVIEGDGGYGKSELLRSIARFARRQKVRIVELSCMSSYLPVRESPGSEILHAYIHPRETSARSPNDAALNVAAELAKALGDLRTELSPPESTFDPPRIVKATIKGMISIAVDAIPFWASIKTATDLVRGIANLADQDNPDIQRLLDVMYFRILEEITQEPTLVLIDDAHFIDPKSCELILRLSGLTAENPFTFVLAFRPSEAQEFALGGHPLTRMVEDGVINGSIHRVTVESWTIDTVGQYLERRYPGLKSETGFLDGLWQSTKGFPLFVIELLSLLVENGRIKRREGAWRLVGKLERGDLPKRVEAVILEKLRRAGEDIRATCERASIEGEQFHYLIVSALTQPLDEGSLREHLRAAEKYHGLIRTIADRHIDSLGGLFAFSHALIHDYVYSQIPMDTQQILHGLTADQLVALSGTDRRLYARQIVWHSSRAAQVERVCEYSLHAAEQAMEIYDWRTAQVYADAALERAGGTVPARTILGLRMIRCSVLYRDRQWDQAVACLEGVRRSAEDLDVKEVAADSLNLLSHIALVRENLEEAQSLARRSLEAARLAGDGIRELAAIARWHRALQSLWPPERRADTYRLTIKPSLLDVLGRARADGTRKVEVRALRWLSRVSRSLGENDEARECLESGLRLANAIDEHRTMVELYYLKIELLTEAGDVPGLSYAYEESISLARRLGDRYLLSDIQSNFGGHLKEMEHFPEAVEKLQEALQLAQDLGSVELMCVAHATLASTYEQSQQLSKAKEQHERHLELARGVGNLGGMIAAMLGIARLRLQEGDDQGCLSELACVPWPTEGKDRERIAARLLEVEALTKAGLDHEAQAALQVGLDLAKKSGDGYWLAQVLLARAQSTIGDWESDQRNADVKRAVEELQALSRKWPTSLPLKRELGRAVSIQEKLSRPA